jgi:hypothetical protein
MGEDLFLLGWVVWGIILVLVLFSPGPNTIDGIRAGYPRVAGINTFDLGGTMLIAEPLGRYCGTSYWTTLGSLLVLGTVLHVAFNQSTSVTRALNLTQ